MVLSGIMSLLGCLSKPFGRKVNDGTKCSPASIPDSEDRIVVELEQDEAESESGIKAHLLLRLLGGEDYGSISSSTLEMDVDLWSMLPEELLSRVVHFLPFISKLRFRTVCKEWRYLLSSFPELDNKDNHSLLQPPRTPLVCAYRFIHGRLLRDRGVSVTKTAVSLESRELRRKFKCHELQLLFPDIDPLESRGCRLDAKVSAEDGVLSIEIWKERQLLHGSLRRHRGVPTVLDLFTYLVNPITNTVLSLPQLRTEGDHSLGRNLGLVSTKVVPREGRFDTMSFYWTSWWLDVGIGLIQNTSWFARVRRHPIEVGRYPESVTVRDRSGDRNLIGIGITELEAGKFQAVISDGVVYGVHYLSDGSNRLFTRTLHTSQTKQWSQWHDDASVPKVDDAIDVRFGLVEHRVTQSVFFVGQSCHKNGRLIFRICRLQPDCYPSWFWLPISVMPSHLVDSVMALVGTPGTDSAILDKAFVAGDSIILVICSSAPPSKVSFVTFDVYEETWQIIFTEEGPEELAGFEGFFEVRPDIRLPH